MKLRQKFLLLVAALLCLVLGGSFYVVFEDFRSEFLTNFQQELQSSAEGFRSQEQQRYQTLEVIGSFLESSPSFRNVLRRSDYETLYRYLLDVNGSMEITLLMVCDLNGKVVARTDQHGASGQDLSSESVVARVLEGEAVRSYWLEKERCYQVAALPLVDAEDYVDGVLLVGFELNQEFLSKLKQDLGVEVALKFPQGWSASTLPKLLETNTTGLMTKEWSLAESAPPLTVILGRDLTPMHRFVRDTQSRLAQLAGLALLLALLVSVPLIGKMTNPVELLEQTKAEMETIIQSNLDGLLAADEKGRISTCNAAASVALGRPLEELVGMPLSEALPPEVQEQLQGTPGVTQSAGFRRQGRNFRLHRSYVRLASAELLGTIILLHDITEEQGREQLFLAFLSSLEHTLQSPETSSELHRALRNLQVWLSLKRSNLELRPERVPLDSLTLLQKTDSSSVLHTNRELLKLVLGNLLHLSQTECEQLQIREDGGAVSFEFPGTLSQNSEEPLDPFHSPGGLDALALFVSSQVLELQETRLRINEEKISFTLPKYVELE